MRFWKCCGLLFLVMQNFIFAEPTSQDVNPPWPVRGGLHFQALVGWGYGPTSGGLFHNMELGGTFRKSQVTVALQHTFIQSKGFAMPSGGEHLVGGWMLMLKKPIWNNRLVAKGAAGLGGIHDQTNGIKATAGVGIAYGLDYDLPILQSFGVTISFQCLHAFIPGPIHHFWAALGAGFTFF